MKIIAIGDIHGREHWKPIISEYLPNVDKVVFTGDYLDSFTVPRKIQFQVFKELIALKLENPEKIILLLGNHDYHYLPYTYCKYSGYSSDFKFKCRDIYREYSNLFQICYIYKNVIFSHAGISQTWFTDFVNPYYDTLEESINRLFFTKPGVFDFRVGPNNDIFGDNIYQTPLWIRPKSLIADKLDGYTQVVGHTEYTAIWKTEDLFFINTYNEFLLIEEKKGKLYFNIEKARND